MFVLFAFTLTESGLFVWSLASGGLLGLISFDQTSIPGQNPILRYSFPLSIFGWSAIALIYFQGRTKSVSQAKRLFLQLGLGSAYDLMVGMRGGTSRLVLLQHMETPRHRQELSELTGIDWKEVDREVGLLEKYGLVKMSARSGTVKLYQVTKQGSMLVELIEELNAARPA